MTRQRLDDFQLNTLADALEQTPGIQVGRRGNLTEFRARGSLVNLKVDGARQMSDGWGVTTYSLYSQDDMAELDRIEVLKGSSGANCVAAPAPRRSRRTTPPAAPRR
jgi:outer membrane receptor for ferric coprogen and ferric-rhodotorulic acid